MEKNCECNHDHNHEQDGECGCGGNHDHSHGCGCEGEQMEFINLTLDSGEEVEYGVVGTFGIEDKMYIALLTEEEDIYLYEYVEIDDEEVDLINIEDDDEFDLVSETFMELFVEE